MKQNKKKIPTIWNIPDDLWNEMKKILPPEAGRYNWKTCCTIQKSGWHNIRKDWMSVEEDTKRIPLGSTCQRFRIGFRKYSISCGRSCLKNIEANGIGWNWQSLYSITVKASSEEKPLTELPLS